MQKKRSLLEIKKRGRWVSDKSSKRYEKAAVVLNEIKKLDSETILFGTEIMRSIEAIMGGTAAAPTPPRPL